jgi:hypothetical protein
MKPRVTEILSRFFPLPPNKAVELALSTIRPGVVDQAKLDFAAIAPGFFIDKAAKNGTAVHDFFFEELTGKPVLPVKGNVAKACQSLRSWLRQNPIEVEVIEPSLDGLNYTGTPDLVGVGVEGYRTVYDLKFTTESYVEKWTMQLTGYCSLLLELGIAEDPQELERVIIWINKKDFGVKTFHFNSHNLCYDMEHWDLMVQLWYYLEGGKND